MASACSRSHRADAPAARGAGESGTEHGAVADGGPAPIASSAPTLLASRPSDPPACEDAKNVRMFVAPGTPWIGAPLRILAVSDKPLAAELRVAEGAKGKKVDPASVAAS